MSLRDPVFFLVRVWPDYREKLDSTYKEHIRLMPSLGSPRPCERCLMKLATGYYFFLFALPYPVVSFVSVMMGSLYNDIETMFKFALVTILFHFSRHIISYSNGMHPWFRVQLRLIPAVILICYCIIPNVTQSMKMISFHFLLKCQVWFFCVLLDGE